MRLSPWPDALPAGIEIHRLDLDLDLDLDLASEAAATCDALTPAERARAQRFARHADRVRFVQTRSAVRCLLAQRLACAPAAVPLAAGPHGKPLVEGDADAVPLFNVSHAGAHALIAVADPRRVACLGVDIEAERPDFDAESVLALAFTERECGEVRGAPHPLGAFYQRWVGKEAVLKAVGVGVAEHLRCVGIHPTAHGVNGHMAVACSVAAWQGIKAMALAVPPGYAAALAWQTKEAM